MTDPVKPLVLVVEDAIELQKLVRRRAEHVGLDVVTACTGAEGFAEAVRARPSLVLLDLHLPDESGLALLRRLKADARTACIPVVAWSGGDALTSAASVRAGAVAYFEKTDLKPLVARMLELVRAQAAEAVGRGRRIHPDEHAGVVVSEQTVRTPSRG